MSLRSYLSAGLVKLKAAHDKLKGFRTLLFAGLMLTIDVLDTANITAVVPPAYQPIWMIAHPLVFGWLRLLTKGPVGVVPAPTLRP